MLTLGLGLYSLNQFGGSSTCIHNFCESEGLETISITGWNSA